MKTFTILVVTEAILLLFLAISPSLFIKHRLAVTNLTDSANKILPLTRPTSFTVKYPFSNLEVVSLEMKNPNIENQQTFRLDILNKNQELLKSLNFNGLNIGDPGRVDLKFVPIPVTDNQITMVLTPLSDYPKPIFFYADKNDRPVYQLFFRNTNPEYLNDIKNFFSRLSPVYLLSLLSLNLYLFRTYSFEK